MRVKGLIKNQADKWWDENEEKYQLGDYQVIQYQIL